MREFRHRLDRSESTLFLQRTTDGPVVDVPRMLEPDEPFSSVASGYFIMERALVDGSLPDPSPQWEMAGWIGEYQWDVLIYMWSNAEIRRTSESFSGTEAAYTWCGIYRDVRGQHDEQVRRKASLFPGLERAGLIEITHSSPQGFRVYKELKLAPAWTAGRISSCDIPRTFANLSLPGHGWFKVPFDILSQKQKKHRLWSTFTHRDRRVLMALYCYYDEATFGAVDPNHLRLEGDELVASGEFMRACGASDSPGEAWQALAELMRRRLVGFMAGNASFERAYPSDTPTIRHAERSPAADGEGTGLVGLRVVPNPGDPEATDD
ncbi:MAG: hypothetical protein PF636_05650 [Actinomycetota bacterium]|jgi:hypothetical protein|nr:hypothetical protein [Actinomycetota bacterium]